MTTLPTNLTPILQRGAPLLSLVLAGWVVGRFAERTAPRLGMARSAIAGLTPGLVVAAIVSARLLAMLPHWRVVAANPLDLVRASGPFSFWGGAAGAVVALLVLGWRAHLPVRRVADTYGAVLPLGFAVHGLACLARGDCYGRTAPPPLGIVFPGLIAPRYPVELYAAALALLTYAGLQWLVRRQPAPGTVALAAVAVLAMNRAVLDPLRLDAEAGFVDGDFLAMLGVAALALVLLQVRLLRSSRRPDGAGEPVPTTIAARLPEAETVGGKAG